MDAQFPGVAEGFDHFRLGGQVLVLAVRYLSLVREGLEVGAVLDAVGRVDVDHLHLAAHALLLEEAVHHQQAVARDQAVAPVVGVPVELDGLAQRRVLFGLLEQRPLARVGVGLAYRLDDAARVDPLVYVQRDGGNLEIVALGLLGPAQLRLSRPDQLRVEMRVMRLRAGERWFWRVKIVSLSLSLSLSVALARALTPRPPEWRGGSSVPGRPGRSGRSPAPPAGC